MGDRHGGCFARRGRALNPPRRGFPMARCGVPMARGGGQDLPARERSPRQKPPETAHERKNLPARERSPRQKPTDTAHGRKDLPSGVRVCPACRRTAGRPRPTNSRKNTPSAKASRHGARAKEFVPRRNAPHGEGLPTRRTSERICPAGVRPRPTCRRTAGRPRPTDSRKNTPSAGSHPRGRGRCRVHSPKKIRLLHEIQFFYGESHVGSRPIFPSFPSVGRCAARERTPVPPVTPHHGSGHRGLRRTGEMCHGFGEMVR